MKLFFILLASVFCFFPLLAEDMETELTPADIEHQFSTSGKVHVSDNWWTGFSDNSLNTLIKNVLAGNLTLAATYAKYDQAKARLSISEAARKLQLNGVLSMDRTKRRIQNGDMHTISTANTISATISADYDLDIWKKLSNAEKAVALEVLSADEDIKNQILSLTAETAKTWIRYNSQKQQLDLICEQLKTNQATLELIQLRKRAGTAGLIDILQQQQALSATQTLIPQAKLQLETYKNQLLILQGKNPLSPEEFKYTTLPVLPPIPETGIPTTLLEKRPDIINAWYRLNVEKYNQKIKAKDHLPTMKITSTNRMNADQFNDMTDNWSAGLALTFSAPVYDGGKRIAENTRQQHVVKQRIFEYRNTVLSALSQVEIALITEEKHKEYIADLKKELEFSSNALEEAKRQYLSGMKDYLSVLNATLSAQRLERDLLRAQQDLLVNRVSLYQALGGGLHNTIKQ